MCVTFDDDGQNISASIVFIRSRCDIHKHPQRDTPLERQKYYFIPHNTLCRDNTYLPTIPGEPWCTLAL